MESTQDILRQYSDESLCKNPIHWTDRLLELLGCAFDVRLEDAARIANSLDRDMVANGTGRTTAERLADSHQKWHLIFVLLERCKLRTHWTGALFLYLGQVRVGLCSCYEFSLPDSSLPLVTSVNLDDIRHFREQSVVQPRCCYERRELPTQIAPPDPVRDPYIVSLITALAQKQALHRSTGERPLMIRLLASSSLDSRFLYLYTATLSDVFLQRLSEPSKPLPRETLSVQVTCIPYKPYDTFLARLLHHIGVRGRGKSEAEEGGREHRHKRKWYDLRG